MSRRRSARRTCEICGVKEAHSPEPIFFANFPLDENRCREWVRVSGNEDLVYLPIEKLNTIKHVCARHFKPKDFNKNKNRLKKRAVPCLNLMSSPLRSDQMTGFPFRMFTPSENTPSTSKKGKTVKSPESEVAIASLQTEQRIQEGTTQKEDQVAATGPVEQESRGVKRQLTENEVSLSEDTPSKEKRKTIKTRGTEVATDTSHTEQKIQEGTTQKQEQAAATGPVEVESRGVKRQLTENEELTPRKKKLVEKLMKTKHTLKSLKRSAILLEKIDSPVLRELVVNSCKNEKKKPKGRRWTVKHKLSCLAILKRSPKTYQYLRAAVTLPSVRTLQNILKKIPMQTGINQAVLNHLKNIESTKSAKEKVCCLAFDEMAIKSRLLYNETTDTVEGFEDLGEFGRTNKLADHALVFMLQGVYKKFKQPIAFYFTNGTISSAKLAMIIKKIITEVAACGFTVLNTVCDQGSTNMGALKILREATGPSEDGSKHYFKVQDKKVYIMYDVPHLFKSLRNNFLNTGSLLLNGKKAKWEHLVEMEMHNRSFLFLNKISQAHINPKYKSKMRVKLAAQLLSNTTAAVLKLMARAESGEKATELQSTAEVVRELDLLFDLTNGPCGPQDKKKQIRQNVSEKSIHMDKWAEYIKKLNNTQFLHRNGVPAKNVKCVEGYITSLKSLRDIWTTVKALEFKYLNLRNLNQDALENLFGVIRQHSPTNRNPTVAHFIAALKTAVVTGLTAPHSRGANCEKDNKELLTDFHNFVFDDETPDDGAIEASTPATSANKENILPMVDEDDVILNLPEDEYFTETDFSLLSEQPTVYVAGYLASQLLKKNKCEQCKQYLTVSNPGDNEIYSYIMLREWWENKFSLTYPSLNFCQVIKALIEITENEILPKLHENNICILGCTLYVADSPNLLIACTAHATEVIKICHIKTCKLLIRRQCQRINQSLALKEDELSNINKRAEQQGRAK